MSLSLKLPARLPNWVFVPYASDVTDAQWDLLEAVLQPPGKRGRKFKPDLRPVVDGMLYVAHTGCQWRYLPESFGPWTRVWSQFRRWSRNGTWARLLAALRRTARRAARRAEVPSMVVIDTHLARGSSNGGATIHDRGGRYGRTLGAKRVVAVDVTGLPVGALVVPASTHENDATAQLLDHLAEVGVRRVGWPDKSPVFRPIAHAWRVEVAHGKLGRSRRLAKSFENTTDSATGWLQVACVATVLRALAAG